MTNVPRRLNDAELAAAIADARRLQIAADRKNAATRALDEIVTRIDKCETLEFTSRLVLWGALYAVLASDKAHSFLFPGVRKVAGPRGRPKGGGSKALALAIRKAEAIVYGTEVYSPRHMQRHHAKLRGEPGKPGRPRKSDKKA